MSASLLTGISKEKPLLTNWRTTGVDESSMAVKLLLGIAAPLKSSRPTYSKLIKIIGFRNILVHDYLNVNKDIVYALVSKKAYLLLAEFVESLRKKLRGDAGNIFKISSGGPHTYE